MDSEEKLMTIQKTLREMLKAMVDWALECDGMPENVWRPYMELKLTLGEQPEWYLKRKQGGKF